MSFFNQCFTSIPSYNNDGVNILVIGPHADEFTSINSALSVQEESNFDLIYSKSRNQAGHLVREICLDYNGFCFDTNRIFTNIGVDKIFNNYNLSDQLTNKYKNIIKKLDNDIKSIIKKYDLIIAVHNNYGMSYTMKEYLYDGSLVCDCERYSLVDLHNMSDFFLTTDSDIFCSIEQDKKYNVVLQDSKNVIDDGSLSVYCAQNNIKYINLEVLRNKHEVNCNMLKYILQKNIT